MNIALDAKEWTAHEAAFSEYRRQWAHDSPPLRPIGWGFDPPRGLTHSLRSVTAPLCKQLDEEPAQDEGPERAVREKGRERL